MSGLPLIGFFPSFSPSKFVFCRSDDRNQSGISVKCFWEGQPRKKNKPFPIFSRTLKVRPCVSSITTEGNDTTALAYSTVWRGVCTDSHCKLCELHSCTQKKSFVPKKRNQIFTFLYVFIKKKEKASNIGKLFIDSSKDYILIPGTLSKIYVNKKVRVNNSGTFLCSQ